MEYAPAGYLTVPQWSARGVVAGFFGAALDDAPSADEGFRRRFPEKKLLRLMQTHSATCWEVGELLSCAEGSRREGDAIFFSAPDLQRRAVGVVTADCVPIIALTRNAGVIIHAGWRGIASGVVAQGIKRLGAEPCEVAVGPCAGAAVYEVGAEVIEAIGPDCVATQLSSGKFLLDMPSTVASQIRKIAPSATIFQSGICTITDQRWHSYRREGQGMRSNLAFVAALG